VFSWNNNRMKFRCYNQRNSALTLKEVLVVIAVLVLLAIFFLRH